VIALVSHDAGGAEILSSYARQSPADYLYVLDGPARAIFARKLGSVPLTALDDAIGQSASVICGTSWQSDLEVRAIKAARAASKPSTAFLDHWVNYRERFVRSGETALPDKIWVGDDIAQAHARDLFPNLPVRLVANPYWADIRLELAALPARVDADGGLTVLYVCEPIRDHARMQFGDERHWGYVEEDALRFFLDNIAALGQPVAAIRIRPHPSEPAGKYHWAAEEFQLPIEHAGGRPLVQEIADSDVVVGCESMAMVVGLLAGKRVVSSIPPAGRPCSLPQPQIAHLLALLTAKTQP